MRLVIVSIITFVLSICSFCNYQFVRLISFDCVYASENIDKDKGGGEEPFLETSISNLNSESKPFTLINQENNPVVLDNLIGKPLVMSFIFTRCPLPDMCPLIMEKIAKVQKELNKEYKDRVFFAIMTFDPEYDTPAVLKKYGEGYGVDYDNLIYLTGKKRDIDIALDHFRVYAKEEAPGQISHTMETMVMDEKGVIKRIFPTSIWNPKSVVEEVKRVIKHWEATKNGK